jgi:hypothetical protein
MAMPYVCPNVSQPPQDTSLAALLLARASDTADVIKKLMGNVEKTPFPSEKRLQTLSLSLEDPQRQAQGSARTSAPSSALLSRGRRR